eukprot:scaffold1163_cov43-Prasinocladus_malaysianus.AAC.1
MNGDRALEGRRHTQKYPTFHNTNVVPVINLPVISRKGNIKQCRSGIPVALYSLRCCPHNLFHFAKSACIYNCAAEEDFKRFERHGWGDTTLLKEGPQYPDRTLDMPFGRRKVDGGAGPGVGSNR